MLSLALLYRIPESPLHKSEMILEHIWRALEYSIQLQHADGSYDEWYPNERGWAGPTAYILYAQARTCQILRDKIPSQLQARLGQSFQRAVKHLQTFEETDVLANHQILAALAVKECEPWIGCEAADFAFSKIWPRFLLSCEDEGWCREYDGADPGYLSATLSFAARLHRLGVAQKEIERFVEPQLQFLSYFFYPNGEFGGCIGSRGTTTIFHFGLEYWASYFPIAAAMALSARRSVADALIPSPGDHDDHYFLYRMHEFIEAFEIAVPLNVNAAILPYQRQEDFCHYFERAGIWVIKEKNIYLLVNAMMGGSLRAFSTLEGREIANDSGWCLENSAKYFTNSFAQANEVVTDRSGIVIRGGWCRGGPAAFNQWQFVMFRIVLFFPFTSFARWFKSLVRRHLMSRRSYGSRRFVREVRLNSQGVRVIDRLWPAKAVLKSGAFTSGGRVQTRFVPQSNYFEMSEIQREAFCMNSDEMKKCQQGDWWVFEREFPGR